MHCPRFVLALALLLPISARAAEPVVHARYDSNVVHYAVNRDLTYTMTESVDVTLHTRRALQALDRAAFTFYPDKQTLELVEAWVTQPDGSRVTVPPASIFTRPTAAAQNAPGFTNSQTTTVLFPQLQPGSHTHAVWKLTQTKPTMFGFDARNINIFDWDTGVDETRIDLPADVPLVWKARGGFTVTDETEHGTRHIVAQIRDTKGRETEPGMVSQWDFMPLFEATTLTSFEQIGAIVYRDAAGRAAVTPAIQALADRIAGQRTGLEAARALYEWVTSNIRYVAVYLSIEDGWVPHAAGDVLKAGYGDCKDYVVLMQALLAAKGIEGQLAALDWGSRYQDPILWAPDFANHAILYLPAFDRYLNPTDRYASFEALSDGLAGKLVVLATPEGRLARTPAARPATNRYTMQAAVTLDRNGTFAGTARYTLTPNLEIGIRGALARSASATNFADAVLRNTLEGGFGDLTASNPLDLAQPLTLAAQWHSPHAVNPSGKAIFMRVPAGLDMFPPGEVRGLLRPSGKRNFPMRTVPRDLGWLTVMTVPDGMVVSQMPDDVTVENAAGRYTARYRADGPVVTVDRNLVITREVTQPDAYPELEALLYAPAVDVRAVMVLSPAK